MVERAARPSCSASQYCSFSHPVSSRLGLARVPFQPGAALRQAGHVTPSPATPHGPHALPSRQAPHRHYQRSRAAATLASLSCPCSLQCGRRCPATARTPKPGWRSWRTSATTPPGPAACPSPSRSTPARCGGRGAGLHLAATHCGVDFHQSPAPLAPSFFLAAGVPGPRGPAGGAGEGTGQRGARLLPGHPGPLGGHVSGVVVGCMPPSCPRPALGSGRMHGPAGRTGHGRRRLALSASPCTHAATHPPTRPLPTRRPDAMAFLHSHQASWHTWVGADLSSSSWRLQNLVWPLSEPYMPLSVRKGRGGGAPRRSAQPAVRLLIHPLAGQCASTPVPSPPLVLAVPASAPMRQT